MRRDSAVFTTHSSWICPVLIILVITPVDPVSIADTLEYRLNELPGRLRQLSSIVFPDGVPGAVLDFYIPRNVNSTRCLANSEDYAKGLKNFTRWAVQMWDSSGKFPSGLLHGHFHSLGNFKECIQVADISPFNVQHCTIGFGNLVRHPTPPKNWGEVETVVGGVPVLKERLTLGLCLPASCELEDLSAHYTAVVRRLNLTVHLDKYSCTRGNESAPFSTLDLFVIVFLTSSFAIVVMATIVEVYFHNYPKKGTLRDLITAFSAYANCKFILRTNSAFSSIDGIRFLSVAWVLVSHHCLFDVVRPALNYVDMVGLFSKFLSSFILNGVLGVDNFIIINGVLITYYFMVNIKNGVKFNLILFYAHRLVRVLPAYTTQILITMTIFPRLLDGPLWKNYVARHTEDCYKNWWTNVLFINNYVNANSQCIPSSWYLSVDMQLYLVSPAILLALAKWRHAANFLIPSLVVAGNAIAFYVSYANKYPAGSVIASDYSTVEKHAGAYITTHTRIGQWAVGLGLGYLLFVTKGKQVKLKKNTVKLLWILCALCSALVIFSISYFHQENVEYNRLLSSAYSGFGSTVWAFCIAWVIFACENGYGGPVKTFLSWNVFKPLSTLTYVIYLLHVGVQYGFLGNAQIANYVQIPFQARDILGELMLSILLAPGISLAFELPYINMERILRKQYFPSKQPPKAVTGKVEEDTKKESLTLVAKA